MSSTPAWTTPPAIARETGKDVGTVLTWIHKGELVAYNLAARSGQRPRYRVLVADWKAFLLRRQVQPPAPRQRRQCRQPKRDDNTPEYV